MRSSLAALAAALLLSACRGDGAPQVPANKLPADHTKQNLLEFNMQYQQLEEVELAHYVDSLHLQVAKHKSGVYFQLLSPAIGRHPAEGDLVDITYSVSLLDGAGCDELNNRNTRVELGKAKLPKGVEWAVMQLTTGGSGFFIIPAMLAYGVSGRDNCVPPYSPVRCSITLNKIDKAE